VKRFYSLKFDFFFETNFCVSTNDEEEEERERHEKTEMKKMFQNFFSFISVAPAK
jgi:hypothetical protein